jgi:hypothetical protein
MNRPFVLTLVAGLFLVARLSAVTIVSVTGRLDGGRGLFAGPVSGQTIATSWIQSDTFTDVSITASVGTLTFPAATGTAYLMNKIGPGATVANEIASAPFTALPGSDFTNPNLFIGLNLSGGTYYLVLFSGNQSFWGHSDLSTTTTAPGVVFNGDYVANGISAYPPAGIFLSDTEHFLFSVSGTEVPEPSTMLAPALGAAVIGGLRLRRR